MLRLFNSFVFEILNRHQCANAPIILGGFDPATVGWYVLLVLYACLTVYTFAVLISTKNQEPEAGNNANVSPVYMVSLCASNDADGNPCWFAESLDIESVIGIGESPAEAVDNLLSQINNQKFFENSCVVEKEGEGNNND